MAKEQKLRYEGSPDALRRWQRRMGYSYSDAALALGMSRASYASFLASKNPTFIDYRTALACSAIELGVEPLEGKEVPYVRGSAVSKRSS